MLCTYTNVAVDHLVEGLVGATLSPLRVGYVGKVKQSLLEHTLEHKLTKHPLAAQLQRIKDQMEKTEERLKALETRIKELQPKLGGRNHLSQRLEAMEADAIIMSRQIETLKAKGFAVYLKMVREIVVEADVVSDAWQVTVKLAITYSDSGLHDVYNVCITNIECHRLPLGVH